MSPRVRPARPEDYSVFVRLFPGLAVDDPILERGRWEAELMAGTLIVEEGDSALAYAYFQVLAELGYVRHIVVDGAARRRGLGRLLMDAIAHRARELGARRWCLNVKADNAPAIALYERCGLAGAYRTKAMRIDWAALAGDVPVGRVALPIEPADDGAVESALGFVSGIFADARERGGRVLLRLVEGSSPRAAAVFDPAFPGAYPFRANTPDDAVFLLRALRAHARAGDAFVNVVVEGQPEIADRLVALGGSVRFDILHMKGEL